MDECGICNSEVLIFFHRAINLLRLHLVNEYSELQRQYFEEQTTFKYWHDYFTNYSEKYQVKFEKYMDGIQICDSFIDRYMCINGVMEKLYCLGYEGLLPATLVKSFQRKEKTIDEVTGELNTIIRNEFFNKL